MKVILEQAKALSAIRNEINKVKEEVLEPLQNKRDELQASLIAQMKEMELKSLKTEESSFSIVTKKSIAVDNEKDVMEYLKTTPHYDFYVQPKLDTVSFKSFANSTLKEYGEVIPGTSMKESTYMSITKNK